VFFAYPFSYSDFVFDIIANGLESTILIERIASSSSSIISKKVCNIYLSPTTHVLVVNIMSNGPSCITNFSSQLKANWSVSSVART
jgi:hypothetical protein